MNDKDIYKAFSNMGFKTQRETKEIKRKGLVGGGIAVIEELQRQNELFKEFKKTGDVNLKIRMLAMQENLLNQLFKD
jgi:hypothetical protein